MNHERILIEGIGGIGGVVAARMLQAGYNPTLVTGNPAITAAINGSGLRIITSQSSVTVPAQAYTSLQEIPAGEPFDAAYLIMKTGTVLDAARSSLAWLKPDGYVVTLQNGIVEDAVAEIVGSGRVVGGVIAWNGVMHSAGVYEKTSPGNTFIGELDGSLTPRLDNIKAVLQTASPVVVSRNIRGALWSKLAINCTITTIGALTGDLLGDMMRDRRVRRIFIRTYGEVVEVAEAQGIQLERIAANPKALYAPRDAGMFTIFFKEVLARLVAMKYGKVKSSSLQSLERGRKTEIDTLNGYVVREAQRVGVPVPVNTALTDMTREIENSTRRISRQNIDDLLARLPGL